jgi:hypothetical protein
MNSDVVYYSRRAREEREAATSAAGKQARQSHLRLAEAYELRVRELAAEERRSAIRLVSAA